MVLVLVCAGAGVATGLFLAFLLMARHKTAGLLCVEQVSTVEHRVRVDYHAQVDHRHVVVHVDADWPDEPVAASEIHHARALPSRYPSSALNATYRPVRHRL